MSRTKKVFLSRRSLLTAAAAIGLPPFLPSWLLAWVRPVTAFAPLLHWKLQEDGDFAVEAVSDTRDSIASRTQHAIWVGQGRNRALRFDGYSVWVTHTVRPGIALGTSITAMAWIALEAYPVSEAAILQLDASSETLFRLTIDRFGYLQAGRHPSDAQTRCRSIEPVAKSKWLHLAASMGSEGVTLYRNGEPFGHQPNPVAMSKPSNVATVVIGRSPDCEVIVDTFSTGVINGLLREVEVFDEDLPPSALAQIISSSRPQDPPDLQINGLWCIDDPQRPACHAQPPRAWTNEPHGLIHWGGQYHLFYQKNPDGPYWSRLNWGHMTSPDLLRWTEMPVALTPELSYESKGCWSGSVIDYEGKLTLVYTAVDDVKAGISLAFSDDGIHFTKYSGNPVIPSPPKGVGFLDFRDPFVWREGELYYLIVGSGIRDVGGTALLYRSNDLVNWEYRKQMYSGKTAASGSFWEMPIFVKDRNRHALLVSEIPAIASYWVGSWDEEKFTPISSAPRHLELFNHLLSPTPLIEKNGGIVAMGIIPDERSPKELWEAGWAHLYSLPRSLSIDDSGFILQKPHPNVEALCHPLVSIPAIELKGDRVHEIPEIAEMSFRLRASLKRGASRSVSLIVRRAPKGEEQSVILYDWDKELLTLDRSQSSLNSVLKWDRQTTTYRTAEKDSIHLDVFVDRSVLEVFVDDRAAFAARIYPTLKSSTGVAFGSEGIGAKVQDVHISRMARSE